MVLAWLGLLLGVALGIEHGNSTRHGQGGPGGTRLLSADRRRCCVHPAPGSAFAHIRVSASAVFSDVVLFAGARSGKWPVRLEAPTPEAADQVLGRVGKFLVGKSVQVELSGEYAVKEAAATAALVRLVRGLHALGPVQLRLSLGVGDSKAEQMRAVALLEAIHEVQGAGPHAHGHTLTVDLKMYGLDAKSQAAQLAALKAPLVARWGPEHGLWQGGVCAHASYHDTVDQRLRWMQELETAVPGVCRGLVFEAYTRSTKDPPYGHVESWGAGLCHKPFYGRADTSFAGGWVAYDPPPSASTTEGVLDPSPNEPEQASGSQEPAPAHTSTQTTRRKQRRARARPVAI